MCMEGEIKDEGRKGKGLRYTADMHRFASNTYPHECTENRHRTVEKFISVECEMKSIKKYGIPSAENEAN